MEESQMPAPETAAPEVKSDSRIDALIAALQAHKGSIGALVIAYTRKASAAKFDTLPSGMGGGDHESVAIDFERMDDDGQVAMEVTPMTVGLGHRLIRALDR